MIQSLICLYFPPLLCSIKGWLCTELLISMVPNIHFILFEANFSWIIFFAPGWKKISLE